MLRQNTNVSGSTTTSVDMEEGGVILLLSHSQHTQTNIEFFMLRGSTEIFLRALMEVVG